MASPVANALRYLDAPAEIPSVTTKPCNHTWEDTTVVASVDGWPILPTRATVCAKCFAVKDRSD